MALPLRPSFFLSHPSVLCFYGSAFLWHYLYFSNWNVLSGARNTYCSSMLMEANNRTKTKLGHPSQCLNEIRHFVFSTSTFQHQTSCFLVSWNSWSITSIRPFPHIPARTHGSEVQLPRSGHLDTWDKSPQWTFSISLWRKYHFDMYQSNGVKTRFRHFVENA